MELGKGGDEGRAMKKFGRLADVKKKKSLCPRERMSWYAFMEFI